MDWIKFSVQSKKFLSRCDGVLFKRMKKKIDSLKENPVPTDAKKLKDYEKPTFRIRVGKHRVLYEIRQSENFIFVVKIDKRDKVYE